MRFDYDSEDQPVSEQACYSGTDDYLTYEINNEIDEDYLSSPFLDFEGEMREHLKNRDNNFTIDVLADELP